MSTVHVFLEQPSARARYAVSQMLVHLLGWSVEFVDDASALRTCNGPRLVYGRTPLPGAFHVGATGLLSATGIESLDPPVADHQGVPVLFPVSQGDLPYDPFAAAFFLLSRYEEYTDDARDQHGRPLAVRSHAVRHGYLEVPVVDHWAIQLANAWRAQDPSVPMIMRSYGHVVTVDFDNGYRYLGRPWWRTLGSWLRDAARGAWPEVVERGKVLMGLAADPFAIDADILAQAAHPGTRVVIFALTADRGRWDHAVPVEFPPFAKRLRTLAKRVEVGVHPSYDSSTRPGTANVERARLEHAIGKRVTSSRQHFLRMRLPATLREIEAIGIGEEHSMGYHERIGFRAGTCSPFDWYDLQAERATRLVVHPFAVMDNTLRNKLRLEPAEAVDRTLALVDAVRAVRGTFTGLWHESFLATTGPSQAWRAAILRILEAARP